MPISAIELPSDEDDEIWGGELVVEVDDSGLCTLPEPTISQPMQDGIATIASSVKIGWRQMYIKGTQLTAGVSYSMSSTWANLVGHAYVNKNLIPEYVYSLNWPATTSISGGAWTNSICGVVASETFDLTEGAELAGSGFTLTLQGSGGLYCRYGTNAGGNKNYLICLLDEAGDPVAVISKGYFSSSTRYGTDVSMAFNFPSYSFEADQDYTGVRLAFVTLGVPNDVTGTLYGWYAVQVPTGGASEGGTTPMLTLKTSVVEGSGAGQDSSSGLLASIIEWLSRILDGVTAIPGAIANLGTTILDGLKGLFIPSGDELSATMSDFKDWLDTNFPLLALPINILNGFLQFVNLTDGTLPEITFPAFSVGDVVISSGYTFKFAEIPHLETLLPYIRTITTIAVYSAFFAWVWRNIAAIINGSATDFDDGTFDLFDHYRGG